MAAARPGLLGLLAPFLAPAALLTAVPLAIAVSAGGYLSYRYNEAVRDHRDAVVHTYKVIVSIEHVLSGLQDAETGQRGYLITGDPKYLAPLEMAIEGLPNAMTAVSDLVADSEAQLKRLAETERAIARKLEEMRGSIELRKTKGFEAARAAVATDAGKGEMDDIRGLVAAMNGEEARLLAIRIAQTEQIERAIVWIAAIGVALSLAGRVVATVLVAAWRRREAKKTARGRAASSDN